MKCELPFALPFSGFTAANFINCFSSVYLFLEGLHGQDDYACKQRQGLPCDGCGHCGGSTAKLQERYYFLTDLVSGRSALRCRFDGAPSDMQRRVGETDEDGCGTDETVDFVFGFYGYSYRKSTDSSAFAEEIRRSVSGGRPVLARVRQGAGRFRVITGIDGDTPLGPVYTGAQQPPEGAPVLSDIDALLLIGDKTAPRFTLKDALLRVLDILRKNREQRLWEGYEAKLGWYSPDGMRAQGPEERARRMQRVAETMWHTFNCHNFAECFRNPLPEPLRAPALRPLRDKIGPSYGYTHDLAWALIQLSETADWSRREYACGTAEMVELTLGRIRQNDEDVLAAIEQAIPLLS